MECRRELLTFVGHARSLGVAELLLPIVYVATPALDPGSGDEAAALVAATHCESWAELRLVDEHASEYRRAVNRLARRLAEVGDAVAARPRADAIAPPAAELRDDDLVDPLNAAVDVCLHDLDALRAPLDDVRQATARFVTALRRMDAEGADAEVRAAVRTYAAEIDEPSRRLVAIGRSYATHLVDVDPLVLRLIRAAAAARTDADQRNAADLFAALRHWADISHRSAATIGPLGDLLAYLLDHAQPARPQLQRIGACLRGIADGDAILDEWVRRVELVADGQPPPAV